MPHRPVGDAPDQGVPDTYFPCVTPPSSTHLLGYTRRMLTMQTETAPTASADVAALRVKANAGDADAQLLHDKA